MALDRQAAGPDHRFLARQHRVRSRRGIPSFDSQEQLPHGPQEPGITDDRLRQADVADSVHGVDERRHRGDLEIDHPPAARGSAERPSVMDFSRIRRDDVAGRRVHDASTAHRAMRTSFHHPETERRMPVRVVRTGTVDVRAEHARPRRSQNSTVMPHAKWHAMHDSSAPGARTFDEPWVGATNDELA